MGIVISFCSNSPIVFPHPFRDRVAVVAYGQGSYVPALLARGNLLLRDLKFPVFDTCAYFSQHGELGAIAVLEHREVPVICVKVVQRLAVRVEESLFTREQKAALGLFHFGYDVLEFRREDEHLIGNIRLPALVPRVSSDVCAVSLSPCSSPIA